MLNPPTVEPALLTIKEAEARLGVKRSTVYRLVARGELKRVYVGAGARIPAQSIERYLERIGAYDQADGG